MSTSKWERWASDAKLVLHEPRKLILCLVPKIACTSMKLAYVHGTLCTPVPDKIDDVMAYVKQCKWGGAHWMYTPEQLKQFVSAGYHTVGFSRHPLSRLVSCWGDKFEKPTAEGGRMVQKYRWTRSPSFAEFVRGVDKVPHSEANCHFRPQYMFNEGLTKQIVRLEELSEFWADLQSEGFALADLPRHNVSKKRDWRGMYDEESEEIARQYYRRDFDLYGY